MAAMFAHYGKDAVSACGPLRYMYEHVGLEPAWVQDRPLPLRPTHVRFYVGVMTDEDTDTTEVIITPELKHLMARVSHIAKGNNYLAAVEGYLAFMAGDNAPRTVERVRHAFDAARSKTKQSDLFSDREIAAQ